MKVETDFELWPDGTLHVTLPVDVSKVLRVIVNQAGTHFCAVTYVDCENCEYAEKESEKEMENEE